MARNAFWGQFKPRPEHGDLAQRPDVIAMSRGEMYLAALANLLRHDYGVVAAADADAPVDASGNWIPMFTYPCIEYIAQFDLRDKRVFEWGAGASTMYWMTRAKSVTSVENDQAWYERMLQTKADNVEMILDRGDGFPWQILRQDGLFDIIVIDGAGYRYDCADIAPRKLAPGGMVILDNADWHPESAARLKAAGLIQVDFAGFKVNESHASTTSVFLSRDFDFKTLAPTQPVFAMGAKRTQSTWDRPQARRPAE
jgi:predicted O-methyltransferase YrrM